MKDQPSYVVVAALLGDTARALMIDVLMDGEPHPALALAGVANVSPQTASGHLSKLREAGLVAMTVSGRHRLYRLANHRVADAVEALSLIAVDMPGKKRAPRRDIVTARTCYDHLAGRLGVALAGALLRQGHLKNGDGEFVLTRKGRAFLTDIIGVDVEAADRERRAFARPCLDWSERAPHVAGALGAALAHRGFHAGWVVRQAEGRGLSLSHKGESAFKRHFGVVL